MEAAPCSYRLLSHQTLLWHQHLSLPRLRGMHSRLLVSGLPRSLPPLPPSLAPPCLPCDEGRQRAAPHSSSFPPMNAPLQNLHMDVWGPARVSGQDHERCFLLDLPLLRLHSDRGGEFSSDLLRDFCHGEGILQTFTLPASPQQNGVGERRIGLVMEVARTSMIHAAAPHFLWPFAVRYAAHQLNLWPRVSLSETSPTLHWTGKVGDASVFRVWGSRALFYHPTSRCVLPSRDMTLDEVLLPQVCLSLRVRSLGVLSLRVRSLGVLSLRVQSVGLGGAESKGAKSRGAEPRGTVSAGGPRTRLRSGAAGAGGPAAGNIGAGGVGATSPGGAGATAGAGGTRGAEAAGPGGDCTRGTGAAGAGGVGGARAEDPRTRGTGAGDPGAGGTSAGGTGTGGAGAGGTGAGGAGVTVGAVLELLLELEVLEVPELLVLEVLVIEVLELPELVVLEALKLKTLELEALALKLEEQELEALELEAKELEALELETLEL
ncbi:unnamed protein product [Closterium sp. NIES-53]